MLCKNLRSEVHGRAVLLAWAPDRHSRPFLSMCVFSIPRVFYHCPTTFATPVLKNTCRPGRKFFLFQNHYRPCVGHAAARATPDCVHRVTVLCHHAVPHCHAVDPVAYERPTWCVWSMLCDPAPAVPHCPTRLYSSPAVSSVLCSVSTMLCSMLCMSIPLAGGRWLVMAASGRFRARSVPW